MKFETKNVGDITRIVSASVCHPSSGWLASIKFNFQNRLNMTGSNDNENHPITERI